MMVQAVETVQTEILHALQDRELSHDDSKYSLNSTDCTSNKVSSNLQNADTSDDETVVKKKKNRLKRFSASDSDIDSENVNTKLHSESENESDTDKNSSKSAPYKSRIRHMSKTSDSDSNAEGTAVKNEEQQIRMKNKRNKIRDKFKKLVTSRSKEESRIENENIGTVNKSSEISDESNDDMSSTEKIKQIIKERMTFKSSICDPDTSDEEEREEKQISKQKNHHKSTILTSPKPMRMSAKQAMENMQKIKSESNRMLREKEVSLPYHRPKALSLKDIMSRRKPAVSADGKTLPIKMNADQLKQYALQLEQRQKDIMELCKSESEDENENVKPTDDIDLNCEEPRNNNKTDINDSIYDSITENNQNSTDTPITDCNITAEMPANEANHSVNIEKISNSSELHDQASNDNRTDLNVSEETCAATNTEINNDILNVANTGNAEELGDETLNSAMEVQSSEQSSKVGTEAESQLISLYYDSEKANIDLDESESEVKSNNCNKNNNVSEKGASEEELIENGFSDEDIDMEDIEKIIENAEVFKDGSHAENINSPILIRDPQPLNMKPKLTGAPGMVIDLDDNDSGASNKLSGVELLKERFIYFAKLKTPEEIERERETKIKPGTQHIKLKQDLEEQIAEQRSLEWAKRLEEEKQQQIELKALRGEDSDAEDDIEKLEAKIEENEVENDVSSEEEEEEEEITEIEDKPRKKNPLIDDEADESDCDESDEKTNQDFDADDNGIAADDENNSDATESSDDSCEDESSESDDEQPNKVKKGRILKAFEDSDDEGSKGGKNYENEISEKQHVTDMAIDAEVHSDEAVVNIRIESQVIKNTQDDEIQLAQRHKSASDDLFTSQESALIGSQINLEEKDKEELGTQTFSILNENSAAEISATNDIQTFDDSLSALNPEVLSQNLLPSQIPTTLVSQCQSQPIGEDILALCTGNFYDNQFISPSGQNDDNGITQENIDDFDEDLSQEPSHGLSLSIELTNANEAPKLDSKCSEIQLEVASVEIIEKAKDTMPKEDGNILKSILDELHDPEFDSPKPNKYFFSQKESDASYQLKKKFIIDSDDETSNVNDKKKKKHKKRKPEKRALQISDDEEEEQIDEEEAEEYTSDIEDETERIVEYDSEENEVEVKPQNPKKKRKATDFFEQEAELTSEDEWVGSGDEDEAGLDRMEREEGDDDTFHQGKLQSELGQIHIRDVLDQDKREVRIIQELLFEDGDLGDGHRQRKFRWRNTDGEEESGTIMEETGNTQEEEFESEEQWRKERHEREVFLRQMKNETEDNLNVSVTRTSIIKANLCSKTMSSLLMEINASNKEVAKTDATVTEKKTAKDIPSPKKAFNIFQQNYHGSLLTRGRGALARLAALATPLVADDDAPNVGAVATTSTRNFVFTAVAREDPDTKVTKKRKADVGTPRLVKKMKTDEKKTLPRNSLLDHLKA